MVNGKIHITNSSTTTNKKGETKVYKSKDSIVDGREVEAKNEHEAIEKFKEIEVQSIEADDYEIAIGIDFIDNVQVTTISNLNAKSEANTLMREVHYPKYHFIKDDDKYFKNEGYCVRDFIVGKYSTKIKKLIMIILIIYVMNH